MCPEFAGPAPRGLKWRRFRPENAHLRLPDRRKTTGAAGKGKIRSKSKKNPPNQRFPRAPRTGAATVRESGDRLAERGVLLKKGTIVDATII